MQSLSDKLAKLIQKHTLSADEVGIVMQELNDSPYTDANTAHLISLLDGKLLQSMNQDVTDNAACAGTGGQPDPACKCSCKLGGLILRSLIGSSSTIQQNPSIVKWKSRPTGLVVWDM